MQVSSSKAFDLTDQKSLVDLVRHIMHYSFLFLNINMGYTIEVDCNGEGGGVVTVIVW